MYHKQASKLIHCLAILVIALALTLQNTATLRGYSHVQTASAAGEQPGIPEDWLALAQENIRQSEYNISWADQPLIPGAPAGYQAPNRAQDLRFYFQAEGLQVIRRTEAEPTWVWGMALSRVGRGEQLTALDQPALNVAGNQIVYQRAALFESYTNSELGLLQTFHLEAPPEKGDEALVLRLRISGDLTAHAQVGGGLQFRQDGLAVLSYGSLKAEDANGQALPVAARLVFSLDEAGQPVTEMELAFDDQQAEYPLSIQGVLNGINIAWVNYIDSATANYGFSVATAGDVNHDGYSDVLIGAPFYDFQQTDNGAAFLYFGSSFGLSVNYDWTVRGDTIYGWLGYSVATAGDVNRDLYSDIIIGAPRIPGNGGLSEAGRVYLYHGSASGPGGSPNWSLPGEQEYSMYGNCVATAGDVNGDGYSDVIIAARGYNRPSPLAYDVGKVYVYHGSVTGLSTTPAWTDAGYWDSQFLGWSAATAGDVNADGYADVLIGAPAADTSSMTDNGFVRLYYGSGSGLAGSPTLLEGDSSYWDFGTSVSTAGDINGDGYADIIIGIPKMDSLSDPIEPDQDSGGAYFYYGGAPTLDTNEDWVVWSLYHSSELGTSVATAGDLNSDGYADIVIGQPWGLNGGRAWVWFGSSGGLGPYWNFETDADWYGEFNMPLAMFGYSVATAGDVNGDGYSDLLIGAPGYDGSGVTGGVAFAYYGGPHNLSQTPGWKDRFLSDFSLHGYAVASAGDVNGDGYADIMAAAPEYDSSFVDEGAVFVWHGSAFGPGAAANWQAHGAQAEAYFGRSINTAGDVNGDGYSDIIIGAPYYDNGSTDEGLISVWLGSPGGLSNSGGSPVDASWRNDSNFYQAYLGTSVASIGDVNRDGYGDIAAGAPDFENGFSDQGRVMVWHGGPGGLGASFRSPDWYEDGYSADWHLGVSVAGAGDVNRDGYSDLIAGGNNLAMVWHGSAGGLDPLGYDWVMGGDGLFGASVAGAGDVNGDGYSDVVIGAPWYTNSLNLQGMAEAYYGGPSGLGTTASWRDYGEFAHAWFGWSVSGAGDVNGDGIADIVVGAPKHTRNTNLEGEVRVYYGSNWGPVSYNGGDWTRESNLDTAYLGWSVSSAGDVNGDGYADILAGMPAYINNRGEVQLFYGNGAPGKPWLPRQYKANCTTPLHPLGNAGVGNGQRFCMKITAFDPMGRGKFGLAYEIMPLSHLFDGMAIRDMEYYYSTYTNPTPNQLGLNLAQGRHNHWRIRIMHSPVTSPFAPPQSRWMHIPWNSWSEADLYQPYTTFMPMVRK